jgi:hypothetical protein
MRHLCHAGRREYGEQGVCLAVGAGHRCAAAHVLSSLSLLQLPLHLRFALAAGAFHLSGAPSPMRRHDRVEDFD